MSDGGRQQAAGAPGGTDPRVGRILQGRYRVGVRVADGAMGAVYRGERLQLGRVVAIKFLHDEVARDAGLLERFNVEARAMSRLSHPNCVSVIDFGVDLGPYIVMDFVQGKNLRVLMLEGPMRRERALAIVGQVLAGLAHAHAQGIVHRDVKPENIVLGDTPGLEDHVKLLDFGLAKLLDKQSALTMGIALGTPNYMAPEQLGEGTVDARADVYASGVLLYELLTGRKPFGADDVGEVLRKQLHEVAPALGSPVKGGTFSAELEAVVARALAKAPEDRFAGAGAMADAIARVPEARSGTPLSGVAVDLLEAQATILARPNPPARAPAGAHPAQTAARDTAASSKGSVWDALVTSAKIVWRGRVPGQAPKARGRKGLAGWLGTAAAVLMPAAFGVYLATSGEPGDDKSGKESERPDAPRGAVPARAASQDRVPPHPEVKTVQGGGAADRAETAVKGPSVEPAKAASAPKSPVQRKTAGNPRERKAPARLGKPASPRTRWGRWRE